MTLSHLKGHDVDLSGHYPNLYWPFAQHILSGAKIIKEHPNLYAVYLTNHGCGPDGMISHLFAEIMGDKPYLKIEVDEHQSKVGVITRIEAFLNSLSHVENCTERAILPEAAVLSGRLRDGKKDTKDTKDMKEPQQETVYLPPLSVYTEWMALYLNQKGKRTAVLPDYTAQDLHAGKGACLFPGEDRRAGCLEQGVDQKPFTGVGGICDGGQTAAAGRRSDCAA